MQIGKFYYLIIILIRGVPLLYLFHIFIWNLPQMMLSFSSEGSINRYPKTAIIRYTGQLNKEMQYLVSNWHQLLGDILINCFNIDSILVSFHFLKGHRL